MKRIITLFFAVSIMSCGRTIRVNEVYINNKPVKVRSGKIKQHKNFYRVNGHIVLLDFVDSSGITK